ncbi:MAG: Na+/pantothenate symporter, partial [Pirellulaceae bacterium]
MSTFYTPLLADAAGSSAVITFAIYMVAVFVLAGLANRLLQSKKFVSEYFLGSRSLGMWAFALTFAATSASGGSFMGFPSIVYTHGWIVALWIGGYMVVPIVAMGLLGKRINHIARKSGAITIPDLLRERFESRGFAVLATVLMVFFVSFNLIAQFKGGSVILQTLLEDVELFENSRVAVGSVIRNVPYFGLADPGYFLCLLVFAFAVIIYTTYGGFRAVVWTDVMQGFVMVFGVVIMLPLALMMVGGLGAATEKMNQMTTPNRVLLHLTIDTPVEEALLIPKHTWLTIEASDGNSKRVFRTTLESSIDRGQSWAKLVESRATAGKFSLIVPALEITTPFQVEELQADDLGIAISPTIVPETDVRINTADIFPKAGGIVRDKEGQNYVLLEDSYAVQEKGTRPSDKVPGQVRALAISDQALEQLATRETSTLAERVGELRYVDEYDYGASLTAVYSTGPGPSTSSADVGFLPLSLAISFFFMWTFSGSGQPGNMVRLMAFKDSKTLRRSIFTVAIYYSLIYFPLVIIFVCARVILPGWEDSSDRIMPEMTKALTNWAEIPWLAGLLVAAPFAAVMSTMDSFLLMISSSLVRDVYQRNINPEASEKIMKRMSYAVTICVGAGAMIAAVNPPRFLQDIIIFTGSGLSTSFLIPVGLSLYWPRMNKQGAIAGMIGGFVVYMALFGIGFLTKGKMEAVMPMYFHPFLIGALASLLITIVATLMTPPPPEHIVLKYFYRE